MGTTGRLRRRKEWLYEQDPYCPDCSRKMYLNAKGERYKKDDLATLEHVNSKYDLKKRRRKQSKKELERARKYRIGRTILLCRRCNNKRQEKETRALPIKELWIRSGRRPSGLVGKFKGFLRKWKKDN